MKFGALGRTTRWLRRRQQNRVRVHFSDSFYLAQFPEDERSDIRDPFEHFLMFWKKNGYDPSPNFSMSSYLTANPDVAAHQLNPLVHYVEKGISECRPLAPGTRTDHVVEMDEHLEWRASLDRHAAAVFPGSDLGLYLVSLGCEFDCEPNRVDPDYYRAYFPDEVISDCDRHFDEIGWRLGLNPTAWFNTKFYLKLYDDIAQSGMNPFTHFVTQGFRESRKPNDSSFRNFVAVLGGSSVESEARSWPDPNQRFKMADLSDMQRLISKKKIKSGAVVVSLGHSRYLSDVGGIQLYTYVEAQKFNELGLNYLHIAPSKPLPILADCLQKDQCVNITFNNEELPGDFLLSDLTEIVAAACPNIPPISVIVNSLYGWSPELLSPIIKQMSAERHFWVFHDYSTFCSNSTLNFENVSSCHNPAIGSAICSTCRFGQKRAEHVERINELLESHDWRLVTPSPSTSANIAKFLKVDSSEVLTIPHGQIYNGRKLRTFQEKPRIAFVGHPVINKGWLRFLNFVDLAMKDFDFYHFGAVNSNEPGVRYFPLVNQFGNLNMARDLLVEHQIDAVFICPTWEETFCFVAYESLAAGCEIICNTKSGNVIDASIGHSILLKVEDVHSVARVKREVLEARKLDRFVSDFVFTGTIASEYAK